jgi:[FeFe] hydrogenase H-cluster maturation GTPase HydF
MLDTPKANRLHIAIFGKRNAGKSSLINAITGQDTALVSEIPGTTTDPVYKTMELLPVGPVVFIDTAGLDDEGTIGELRIKKALEVMDKTDIAILVFDSSCQDTSMETDYFSQLMDRKIPVIGVINKIDNFDIDTKPYEEKYKIPFVKVSAEKRINIGMLREKIQENAPVDYERSTIAGDIIKP